MENFKFTLFSIAVMGGLLLLGYWAISSIEPGSTHVDKQRQKELEQKNEELTKEVEKLKNDLRLLEAEQDKPAPMPAIVGAPTSTTPPTTISKNQSLINDLQKLIDEKIYMKEKSKGTRVGTVQTFLNLYNNTTKRVDNDYGATTKKEVAAFQKAVGLPSDGEAGPSTFAKMIEWLEKQ